MQDKQKLKNTYINFQTDTKQQTANMGFCCTASPSTFYCYLSKLNYCCWAFVFEVGGRKFYALVSPEGQEQWSIQKYTSISPKTNFKFLNAFADENEIPVSIYNEPLERREQTIEMGFKEEFTMTMKSLEELLATLW